MRVEIIYWDGDAYHAERRDLSDGTLQIPQQWVEDGATLTVRAAEPILEPGMVVRVAADSMDIDGHEWAGHLGYIDKVVNNSVMVIVWDDGRPLDIAFHADELEPVTRWPDRADPINVGDRVKLRHLAHLASQLYIGLAGTVRDVGQFTARVAFDDGLAPWVIPLSYLRRIDEDTPS